MAVKLIKTRAGIQSVEVGFALLDVLARAVGHPAGNAPANASGLKAVSVRGGIAA